MNSSRLLHWLKTPAQIVRLCHSGKQKELFLIGVPFSGGQASDNLTENLVQSNQCNTFTSLRHIVFGRIISQNIRNFYCKKAILVLDGAHFEQYSA